MMEQEIVALDGGTTLPIMYVKVIQQVPAYLSGLAGTGTAPTIPLQVLGANPPTTQALGKEVFSILFWVCYDQE